MMHHGKRRLVVELIERRGKRGNAELAIPGNSDQVHFSEGRFIEVAIEV